MISKSTKQIFKWNEFKKSDQWDQILTRETYFSCIYSQNTPNQAKSAGTSGKAPSVLIGTNRFQSGMSSMKRRGEPADWETGAQILFKWFIFSLNICCE